MGYTHYWYREKEIDTEDFNKITTDFEKLLQTFKVLDIKLADGHGKGEPTITPDLVCFNGSSSCGHPKNSSLVIPWPSDNPKFGTSPDTQKSISGSWYAGAVIDQRSCNGDCSYETLYFPKTFDTEGYNSQNDRGQYFACCKTAFRPYDLAVTVFLVIAKHYLGDKLTVSSDGEMQHWIDAVKMTENAFGYGSGFKI